ncbi:hypothetical protein ACFQL4_02265 [Halosimplex aquaticum]
MSEQILKQLSQMGRNPGNIGVQTLIDQGETYSSTTGENSEIAELPITTAHRVREGRDNPFRVAIPAYEKFTTDGTAGNTETFNLSHDIIKCPNTQDIVVWEGGTYVGQPDAVDYANDSFDYTDDATANSLHVWYMPDGGATLEIQKAVPSGGSSGSQRLYEGSLSLINKTDQTEQPEFFSLDETQLHGWLPTDIKLEVYIRAPYTVRFTDPDGDGAQAPNARLSIPVFKGQDSVSGFAGLVKTDMSQA